MPPTEGPEGTHPGYDHGWAYPCSPLEVLGPWSLRRCAQRAAGDIRVPEDETCIKRAVERAESEGRRVFVNGNGVPHHFVSDHAGAIFAGQRVEEPGFERNYTDMKAAFEPPGGGEQEGLVFRTFGRWLPWRRVFNEYDFWEGYRNRPIIPQADNRHVTVAGNRRARVWGRWHLQEGSDGSLSCLALYFEAGPGGLRKDARYPSGTFGPYPDYSSGPLRDVIGPCGRHLDGRYYHQKRPSCHQEGSNRLDGRPLALAPSR